MTTSAVRSENIGSDDQPVVHGDLDIPIDLHAVS